MAIVPFLVVTYIILHAIVSILTEYNLSMHTLTKQAAHRTRIIRIILYSFIAVIPCFGAYLPNSDIKYLCMKLGNIWFGFFMYYAAFLFLLSGALAVICRIRRDDKKSISGLIVLFCMSLGIFITIYGMSHAQNTKTVTYDIDVDKHAGQSLKVVLIADLHLSVNSNLKMTEEMVDKVNACDADVILVGGDIFTSTYGGLKNPKGYSDALKCMKAKYGVYAVCGNHDVEEKLFCGFPISPVSEAFRPKEMEDFFADSGFDMLYDESVEIEDKDVVIVGRLDGERAGDGTCNRMGEDELLKNIDKEKLVIVLEHEPMHYKMLADNGADLVLSGHTHNGQLFPGNYIVPFFNENGYGIKEVNRMKTIVTAGVGYYGAPMRVGVDSEITVINIDY